MNNTKLTIEISEEDITISLERGTDAGANKLAESIIDGIQSATERVTKENNPTVH